VLDAGATWQASSVKDGGTWPVRPSPNGKPMARVCWVWPGGRKWARASSSLFYGGGDGCYGRAMVPVTAVCLLRDAAGL